MIAHHSTRIMDQAAKRSKKGNPPDSFGTLPEKDAGMEPLNDITAASHFSRTNRQVPLAGLARELKDALLSCIKCIASEWNGGKCENYCISLDLGMLVANDFSRHLVDIPEEKSINHESHAIIPATVVKESIEKGISFVAGIDEIYVSRYLRTVLTPENGFSTRQEEAISVYTQKANRSKKWCTDYSQANSWMLEDVPASLRGGADQVLALPRHDYDIRLRLGRVDQYRSDIRSRAQLSRELDPCAEWSRKEIRYRNAFVSSRCSHWEIGVTEVDIRLSDTSSSLAVGTGPESRLREFELDATLNQSELNRLLPLLQEIGGSHNTNFEASIERLSLELCSLIALVVSESSNEGTPDVLTVLPDSTKNIIREVNRQLLRVDHQLLDFPGSMSYNIMRKSLPQIRDNDYFLTEKSDGNRFILYSLSLHDQGSSSLSAVLVDRSGTCFGMAGAHLLGRALGANTVLDGELVYNRNLKRHMYLVFDVLAIDGVSLVPQPFSQRLQHLSNTINAKIDAYLSFEDKEPNDMLVLRKHYYQKKDFRKLLANIRLEKGERVYFSEPYSNLPIGIKRSSKTRDFKGSPQMMQPMLHKSDGVILQPDSFYKFGGDETLLKWKWSDLRSVDLQVLDRGSSGLALNTLVQRGTPVDCSKRGSVPGGGGLGLATFDLFRLRGDVRKFFGTNKGGGGSAPQKEIIAELMFDPDMGHWRYSRLRPDKDKPNFMPNVMNVLMEQAEDISVEELELILLNENPAGLSEYLDICRSAFIKEARRMRDEEANLALSNVNNVDAGKP